jgi:hypothetical protein
MPQVRRLHARLSPLGVVHVSTRWDSRLVRPGQFAIRLSASQPGQLTVDCQRGWTQRVEDGVVSMRLPVPFDDADNPWFEIATSPDGASPLLLSLCR